MAIKMLNCLFVFLSMILLFGAKLHGRELQYKTSELDSVKDNVLNQTQSSSNNWLSENYSFSGGIKIDDERKAGAAYMSKTGASIAFYGFIATISVHSLPNFQIGQQSTAFFTLTNPGDGESVNQIYVGWRVNPQVYGDSKSHFSTFWTRDQNNMGCWDRLCAGFVLDNGSTLKPGDALDQYQAITIKLFKDKATGDWHLNCGPDENSLSPVGHFPSSIFTSLQGNATLVQFGGMVNFKPNQKTPPMGSGKFPSEGDSEAASFKGARYIDQNGNYYPVEDNPDYHLDYKECYDLGKFDGDHFLYGGPGGCTAN